MQHHSNISLAVHHIKALSPDWKAILKASCFGPAAKVLMEEDDILENPYVAELVEKFDPSSEELTLSPQNVIHIRNKAHSLFPLPSGQFMFKHRQVLTSTQQKNALLRHVKETYDLDLAIYKKRNAAVADLWMKLTDKEISKPQFFILFAIALATSVVSPSKKTNLDILVDIIPYERIQTLNWRAFAVDELVHGAKLGKGCIYLLHRAKKVYGKANGIPSPPRGSLLVDDGNVGTFSGSTSVRDLDSMNSSAKTELDRLQEEIQHRISLLKFMDDQINVDEEHGAEHGANQSPLVDDNELSSDDGDGNQQFDDRVDDDPIEEEPGANQSPFDDNQLPLDEEHGANQFPLFDDNQLPSDHRLDQGAALQAFQEHLPSGADHGNESAVLPNQLRLDDDEGNQQIHNDLDDAEGSRRLDEGAGDGEGNENAGHVAIKGGDDEGIAAGESNDDAGLGVTQTPLQEQIPLGDNHGNNQPLLGAAAGEGNEDAGAGVIQAHDDLSRRGKGCRQKVPNSKYEQVDIFTDKHPLYPGSVTPIKAARGRLARGRGGRRRGA